MKSTTHFCLLILFAATTLLSCNQKGTEKSSDPGKQQIIQSDNAPVIRFKKEKYHFGTIKNNEKVTAIFDFENIGAQPLIVQKVDVTCGCTSPDWTKHPVESGGNGSITVVFHPKGITGTFSKSIFVKSNAENNVVLLKIEGDVIGK